MTQDVQENHELSPTVESPPKGTVEETKNPEVKVEESAAKTEAPTGQSENEQKEKPVKKKVAFFEKFMSLFRKKSSSNEKPQSEENSGLKKKKSDKRRANKTKSEGEESKCKCEHADKAEDKKTEAVSSSETKEKDAPSDTASPAQPTIIPPVGEDSLFDKKEIAVKEQLSSNDEGKSTSHHDNQSKGIASIDTAESSTMHTIPVVNSSAGDELLSQDSKINLVKDNLSDVKINSVESNLPPSSTPEAMDKNDTPVVEEEKKSRHSSSSSSSSKDKKIQSIVPEASSTVEETKRQEKIKMDEDQLKLQM